MWEGGGGGGEFTATGVRCTHTVPPWSRSSRAGTARGVVGPTPKLSSAALRFVFLSQQECTAGIRPRTLYLRRGARLAPCLHSERASVHQEVDLISLQERGGGVARRGHATAGQTSDPRADPPPGKVSVQRTLEFSAVHCLNGYLSANF